MSEPFRAFLAVELPENVQGEIARAAGPLREVAPEDARFVPPDNLHLTLKFLGNLEAENLPRLLRGTLPRLAKAEPFEIELGGFGAFPSARAARILWVGVSEGVVPLARLARGLDAAASRVGVERERRPYRGHLTVARLRQPAEVPIVGLEGPSGVKVLVREVVLFRIDLSQMGARYSPMVRIPLGKAAHDFELESTPAG